MQCYSSLEDICKEFALRLNTQFYDSGGGQINFKGTSFSITFLNYFFLTLCREQALENWVDFEIAYYRKLKALARDAKSPEKNIATRIRILNRDVEAILFEFSEYLRRIIPEGNIANNISAMCKLFDNPYLDESQEGNFLREFSAKNLRKHNIRREESLHNMPCQAFRDTLILNFNYTPTVKTYLHRSDYANVVHIHGDIYDSNNTPILGFGDENDDDYKLLENLNNNDFLKLIKSVHYPRSANYKKLFDFIDSDAFQVQLMGHSCALSDRTLLQSIFEHDNCASVKIFYHKKQRPLPNEDADDFSFLVRNISRHFSDKKMMRDKLVNKEYCSILPQNNSWG
ncbi:hypothetical protein GCM10023092_01940 [Rurimicrobium arvi]|uniref:Bacteriophage abortive infection AbiH n=2 Tax=Rurimicrobium arvi TaxID=2049916 RepID=A0ABP8MGF6_9BACT